MNVLCMNIALIPGYASSRHLSEQSAVVRDKLQKSRVHHLETIWTGLYHVFDYHLRKLS